MAEVRPDGAASVARAGEPAARPGLALGLVIALASGLAFSFWGLPGIMAGITSENRAAEGASVLADVAAGDTAAALSTMDIPDADRARLAQRRADCGRRLAWVSIARAPGEPSGKIRLRSGTYFSPLFALGDLPVRVAIPYPGPYQGGRGALAAYVIGGAAVVGTMPTWHVPASNGESMRDVTWQPRARCGKARG